MYVEKISLDQYAVNKRVNMTKTFGAYFAQDSPAEAKDAESNVWDDGSDDVNPFGGVKPSLGLKIEIPEFTGKVHPDDFIDWLSTVERVFNVRDIPEKLKVKLVAIKNMTVEEVINEFDKLRMRCDVVEEEEQVVARFLGVLKPEIADIDRSPTAPKATNPTTSAANNTRERVNNAPCCYKCNGLGHYARDCPNMKTLALVPNDADPIYDTKAGHECGKLEGG
ncbi:reverse transcriptase domain-containing protein [Tanacetum coccineum]